jgi:hypothetical protein
MHRIVLLVSLIAAPLLAQSSGPKHSRLVAGDRFFEANAGFSWFSPKGSLGLITDRREYMLGLRREWILEGDGAIALAYTAEWIPLAVVERTRPGGETLTCYQTTTGRICERDRSARLAVGTGISPVGLKGYLNTTSSVRPYVNGSVGGIAFNTDVPVTDSRRLNYMFEYGGGMDFARPGSSVLTLGFRFHHISNASTGQVNPGLDANVVYLGWRRKR